jgi:hypothetical protein
VLYHPRLGWLVWGVSVPKVVFALLFLRQAKSIYLAIDHFFDPHVRLPPSDHDPL